MSSSKSTIKTIATEIYNTTCPVLDIGDKYGNTGYIDFIDTNDFSEPVRKGIDRHGRKFICFRAIIEYTEGQTKETFMTLFQRYMGYELLWMGAGQNIQLFSTYGGTVVEQLELVLKLLQETSVDVTEDMLRTCRITKHTFEFDKPDNNPPKRIYLVSNENPKEQLEDVMKDLEQKVNQKSVAESISQLATSIQTNDPSILLAPIVQGATEFEARVGRQMTYGEMRAMWG